MKTVHIKDCTKCYELSFKRKHIVSGVGNLKAGLMFIGEAPGYYEDKQGYPFVGKSGKTLDKYLAMCNLSRNDVYITNIVKCRPPNNRVPWDLEIDNCYPYLLYELSIINPKIIVLLGGIALNAFFKNTRKERLRISNFAGKVLELGNVFVIPIYHPSYVIRGTPEEIAEKDNSMKQYFSTIIKYYIQYVDPSHTSKSL